jgi:heparanase 1
MKKNERACAVILPDCADISCNILSPDFLSFTIDTSLLLGGHWWGDSKKMVKGVAGDKVKRLDLSNKRLIAYARALSPAMLRIGGTEADRVAYKPGTKAVAELFKQANDGENKPEDESDYPQDAHEYVLRKGLWKKLHEFLSSAGMSLLFTVSAGPGDRDPEGRWQEENARKLIAYSVKKKNRVAAWEFGNEINGFPFIYGWGGRVSPTQYARDFARFGKLAKSLDPECRVIGPASAVWPKIGEPYPIIGKLCKSAAAVFLDAVSWHYYPQQSSRGKIATKKTSVNSMLSKRAMNGVLANNGKIHKAIENANAIRSNLAPAENWLTETGHALYGGEPGISDTFVSTLWWLDELGLLARERVSKVFRQSLIGSSYGLLDQDTMEPRPDFYASFLWKRLMGKRVYIPRYHVQPDSKLRVYAHANPAGKKFTLLFINTDKRLPAQAAIKDKRGRAIYADEIYLLRGIDGIRSKEISLNGVQVENDLVFSWNRKKTIEKYRIKNIIGEGENGVYSLDPLSILFLCFHKEEK